MSEPKTVEELEVGYSKSQIYWRIKKLVESDLMEPLERGERNQYLFEPEDENILQKLAELEDKHDTVQEAIAELEVEGVEEESTQEELQNRIKELERKTEEMAEKIEVLEGKTEILENELTSQNDRLEQFSKRWKDQLRGGVEKVKDLFGSP